MIEKTVTIDGREWKIRSSGLLPRKYRAKFQRDLVMDMQRLMKAAKAGEYEVDDLEIFERVAWIMLDYAGEDVGESPDEWLESLDGVFSVYEAVPAILEIWRQENKTTSVPRKK